MGEVIASTFAWAAIIYGTAGGRSEGSRVQTVRGEQRRLRATMFFPQGCQKGNGAELSLDADNLRVKRAHTGVHNCFEGRQRAMTSTKVGCCCDGSRRSRSAVASAHLPAHK